MIPHLSRFLFCIDFLIKVKHEYSLESNYFYKTCYKKNRSPLSLTHISYSSNKTTFPGIPFGFYLSNIFIWCNILDFWLQALLIDFPPWNIRIYCFLSLAPTILLSHLPIIVILPFWWDQYCVYIIHCVNDFTFPVHCFHWRDFFSLA